MIARLFVTAAMCVGVYAFFFFEYGPRTAALATFGWFTVFGAGFVVVKLFNAWRDAREAKQEVGHCFEESEPNLPWVSKGAVSMRWWQEQRRAWARDWGELGSGAKRSIETGKRLFGIVTRLVVYAALFGALYVFWPTTNMFDKPLASLTLSEILQTAWFIAMAVLLVRFLFNPSDAPETRTAWQVLGVVLVLGALAPMLLSLLR